jgi:hypothetical protein
MPQKTATWPLIEVASIVRQVRGVGWQVLNEVSGEWHTCRKEQDACFIASGLRTLDAITRGVLFQKEVADELDAVAAVVSHVFGRQEADRMMRAAELVRSSAAK